MTIKSYLQTPRLTDTATITAVHALPSPCVRLDHTIFHAQGGGQKGDRGRIGNANVLAGRTDAAAGRFETNLGFALPMAGQYARTIEAVALRPEEIDLTPPGNGLDAVIARARFLGDVIEYTLTLADGSLTVRAPSGNFHAEGSRVGLSFARASPVFLSE